MYAVHEYQTSKATTIIESHFAGLRCFSLSFYSYSCPPFCPTFVKTRSLSLRAAWGLTSPVSSPPSGSEQSPAAKHILCVLLCVIMFNGCAKTVII